jgi:hypothetical protein
MPEEESLQGWVPEPDGDLTVDRLVDFAFDYRGNVTVVKADGSQVVGYIFNRDPDAPTPVIQMFDDKGKGPFNVPYAEIRNILFSGKDTAAGKSYDAWLRRKEKERAQRGKRASNSASGSEGT